MDFPLIVFDLIDKVYTILFTHYISPAIALCVAATSINVFFYIEIVSRHEIT